VKRILQTLNNKSSDPECKPLLGKYYARNRLLYYALTSIDAFLTLVGLRQDRRDSGIPTPERILMANGAHIGDIVLFTALISATRTAFPKAQLGVLVGSWSRHVIADHPDIDFVHVVDHWKLNRQNVSFSKKLKQYLVTRSAAVREIRSVRYDVAIDAYYNFPNSIPLLWRCGIPARLGYTSGGFGPLLTHGLDWSNKDWSVARYQIELLRFLGGEHLREPLLQASVPTYRENRELEGLLRSAGWQSEPLPEYVVLHMGCGSEKREWNRKYWRELAERLSERGLRLVFTGYGQREFANVEQVTAGLSQCLNVVGQLSWGGFVRALAQAQLVVGLESSSAHVAAAVGTPLVAIWSGTTRMAHFRPLSSNSRIILHQVPCAPCYVGEGCETMDCIQGTTPEEVYREILGQLESGQSAP
jgi:ADP-heptose:LPS heptosyltransferase